MREEVSGRIPFLLADKISKTIAIPSDLPSQHNQSKVNLVTLPRTFIPWTRRGALAALKLHLRFTLIKDKLRRLCRVCNATDLFEFPARPSCQSEILHDLLRNHLPNMRSRSLESCRESKCAAHTRAAVWSYAEADCNGIGCLSTCERGSRGKFEGHTFGNTTI